MKEQSIRCCLFFLQRAATDGRIINIAKTLRSAHIAVHVYALGLPEDQKVFSNLGIASRLYSYGSEKRLLWQWLSFLLAVMQEKPKADIYWAEDLYTLPLAVWLSYRAGKKPVVYDARELYSALASLSRRPIVQKFWSALERKSLPSVTALLVSGERDAEAMQQIYGKLPPTFVLKNFPPYTQSLQRKKIQSLYNLPPETPILLYQGMLLPHRGIESGIRVLPFLPQWRYCVIGSGPMRPCLEQLAITLNVRDRCIFVDAVPYEQLLEWTASATVGLSLIHPYTKSYELALPNKLFEYCQARIPAVVSHLPAMREVVDQYGIGVAVPPDIAPADLAVILQRMVSAETYQQFRNRCESAAKKLCWEAQVPEFLRWLESCFPMVHSLRASSIQKAEEGIDSERKVHSI